MNGPGLSLALLCALWLIPASALAQNPEDPFVRTRDRLAEKIEAATVEHLASRPHERPLRAGDGLAVVPASADLSAESERPLDGVARAQQGDARLATTIANPEGSRMTCAVEGDPPILACTVWGRSSH
jgi:hypothetical protein